MFGAVREFQAPMGVTHAVRGRFGPTSSSLGVVFARKNSLDIYVVRANLETARLELLQSTPLGATVVSMAVARRGNSDLLCIGFDRMRVALMSWDHDSRNWITEQLLDLGLLLGSKLCSPSSIMRSLDPEDFGRPLLRGTVGNYGEPLIRSDPSGRCVAVLSNKQNAMYIIPLRSEDDQTRADERVVSKGDIFAVDIPTEYEATNIKDFTFLEGTFEPNILILYEPKRTWAGRAAIQRNTCQLLNLSVDTRSKRHTKSWVMDQLPYDSMKVIAVPESAGGGALIMSVSVIMQVRHGAHVAGLSLNCFGDAYASEIRGKYDKITASDTLVECDAAHCRFLDYEERMPDSPSGSMQCIALLSLKGGELYFLNVAVGSRNAISMKRAGSTVIASEIVPINERFFVLASRLSDSLLVEYQKSLDIGDGKNASSKSRDGLEGNLAPSTKPKSSKRKKRARTAEQEYELIYGVKPPPESSDEDSDNEHANNPSALELEEKDEGTRGVYDDEDELGWVFNSETDNDLTNGKGEGAGNWALKVKDTLVCFGPGADLAVGASPDDVKKSDLVVAGGYAKNGCLAVVHQSVRPAIRYEFQVPGCDGVWTLLDPAIARKERLEREAHNAAASVRNEARRARNTKKHAARKRFKEQSIKQLLEEQKEMRLAKAKSHSGVSESQDEKSTGDTPNGLSEREEIGSKQGAGSQQNSVDQLNGSGEDKKKSATPESAGAVREPPNKKAKSNDGAAASELHDVESDSKKLEEIDEDVMMQIEQQAEAEFPLEEEEPMEEGISQEEALHSYTLLSTGTATTVLKTGLEIIELLDDSANFTTDEKTISAGNVLENQAIVQVVRSMVKILKDGKTQCQYKMPVAKGLIKNAQISDPFILLQSEDNHILVLKVEAELVKEESSSSKSGGMALPGEDMFDEYGMVFSPRAGSEGTLGASSAENKIGTAPGETLKPLNDAKNEILNYENFSFSVEFSTSDQMSDLGHVTASYLYKGPLANEVAKEGILTPGANDSLVPLETTTPHTDGGSSLTAEIEASAPLKEDKDEKNKEGQGDEKVEDEDRMLYGDGDQEEEDMMLYGTTEQDSGTKDTAPDAGGISKKGSEVQNGTMGSNESPTEQTNSGVSKQSPPEKGVIALRSFSQTARNDGHLLVICRSSGALQVLSPSLRWEIVLECPAFFSGPTLVRDSPLSKDEIRKGEYPFASKDLTIKSIVMTELSDSALLSGLSSPVAVALSSTGAVLIYRVFMMTKPSSISSSRSRISMHRIVSTDRTANILARSLSCSCDNADTASDSKDNETSSNVPVVHFRNVAGRSGLFVGGPCPFFLFAERGYPRIHAMSHTSSAEIEVSEEEFEAGQGVLGFTEFNNVKCPRGFISVGNDGLVRIAELPPPSVLNYDGPTPMRKIALRCTPHKVAYHTSSATYGILASMPTLTTREERLARILQSLEKHDKRHYQHTAAQAEAETGDERANRVPPLFEELHELRVYRPDTWDLIKSHKLQKGEVGLAIANMKVDVYKQKTVASGADIPSSKKGDDGNESLFAASLKLRPKDMLVVGTGYLNGEDASSRGRLLLFEISRQEVPTEGGGLYTAFQLQLIAEKELFCPVTAVASMEGYVIAGVGPQVSVYKLVGDEIVHLSFAFGQLYCTTLASLKQYVVAADMCKSVSFMYFRDRNNSVNFLGKDYEHVTSYATEFLIENENMSIIVSDGNANVQLMNYVHASVPESQGGKRLLVNGGLHFGSRINKFVRARAPDKRQDIETGRVKKKAGRHVLMFATLDGGIGALVAVNEVEFRNLNRIRTELLQHPGVIRHAGVNPVEQSAFRAETVSSVLLQQHLLDSRPVFDVFSLTLVEMLMVARQAGTDLGGLAKTIKKLDSILYKF